MASKITLNASIGDSFYTSGIFSAGVYKINNKVVLIDSGSDETSAKAIKQALKEHNCDIIALINTHWHPDHCGGNYFFQKNNPTLPIYAHIDEKNFIEDPKWAPHFFCCGAAPFTGLQNKHIGPQKHSRVTHLLSPEDQFLTIEEITLKIITLPGHTLGSIGIITPDNILYCGDALFGKETFTKHPVLLYTNIKDTLHSLEKMNNLNLAGCVLYHGGLVDNISELVDLQKSRIEIKDFILKSLQHQPLSIDSLTQHIMQAYKISDTIISFTLTKTTMHAYLAYLEQEKAITLKLSQGLLQAFAL